MTLLALSTEETVFWILALCVVAVVVLGVLALIVTLLYLLRTMSGSLAELRTVIEDQALQQLAKEQAQQQAARQQAVQHEPEGRDGAPPAEGPAGSGQS